MRTLQQSINAEDFVVSADLAIDPSMSLDDIRVHAKSLSPFVHALQVGDNWNAEGHIDVVTVAGFLLQDEIDTVVHLSGRDRNRIALQGALLAASAVGVTSLLLSRGDKLPERLKGKVKGVFDTRGSQLYELGRRIGDRAAGHSGFHIGAYAPVINPPDDWQAAQLQEKVAARVNFIQTRPCLNIDMLRRYMQAVVERKITHRVPLIVEIPVLTSPKSAQAVRDLYPGARVPARVEQVVNDAPDPVAAGIEVAANMLTAAAEVPGVSGANIICDGSPEIVIEVLKAAGVQA